MYIAETLTLAAVDTGYNLWDLLKLITGIELPDTGRVAFLQLQRGSQDAYLVPLTGVYVSTTANVPDRCGRILNATFPIFEMQAFNGNHLSLRDINVGIDANGGTLRVIAYSI